MNEKIKQIVNKIAENIIMDTIRYGSAESAAQLQYNQMVTAGLGDEFANAIIIMAMELVVE